MVVWIVQITVTVRRCLMQLYKAVALKPFSYQGRDLVVDDVCELTLEDCVRHANSRTVSLDALAVRIAEARAANRAQPDPEPDEPLPPAAVTPQKRRYRRKDLRAQP